MIISQKPDWLKVRCAPDSYLRRIETSLDYYGLNTVCREARCPNLSYCWSKGSISLMILGNVCTRGCRFCATTTGNPCGRVNQDEPRRIAEFVQFSQMDYVVVTSVARDDLPDGGAGIFAEVIRRIKSLSVTTAVEVLVPDFGGSEEALQMVIAAQPDVLGHNIETVRRLSCVVRSPKAIYDVSLKVLEQSGSANDRPVIKSGFMLGLGETRQEIVETMCDLKDGGVDILTLGQYLAPSDKHISVERYVTPSEFGELRALGQQMGFKSVLAGPLVRSSYEAAGAWAGVMHMKREGIH